MMPLPTQSIEVSLAGGLDQKTGELKRAPGHLERAINVETDKIGRLNKRKGYRLVSMDDAFTSYDRDVIMQHLATRRGELVVISYDNIISLGSQGSNMNGSVAASYRGPCNRGNGRLIHISTSRTTRDASDDQA